MPNTNAQTIHQMGAAINSVVRQATGRDTVQNIDMDFVTVAQNKSIKEITTEPGAIASFFVSSPVVLAKLKAQITPTQTGSGDPSPENVRPIVGVNPLVLNITGIIQWDEEWEVGAISEATGANVTDDTRLRSKNLIPVLPNAQYYVSGVRAKIYFYDASGAFLSVSPSYYGPGFTFTPDSNSRFIRWQSNNQYGTTYNHDISINYPATETEYHPYTGRTQSISFSPTPGTVYGGELEVDENGDGVLIVTYIGVNLGEYQWTKYNSASVGEYFYTYTANFPADMKREGNYSTLYSMLCSTYKTSTRTAQSFIDGCIVPDGSDIDVTQIQIKDSRYSTPEDFKASLSDCFLVYQLKTPETYQISTTPITTISGENNIFTSAGDIEVTYYEYGEVI